MCMENKSKIVYFLLLNLHLSNPFINNDWFALCFLLTKYCWSQISTSLLS